MFNSHEFKIRIGGKEYEFKTGFSFTRSLSIMNASFELSVIDPDQEIIETFRPGGECSVVINGVVLAKVYLDEIGIDDTNGHVYTYKGRDRAGDLIDCSASFSDGKFERKNITLDAAVKDVLSPFNMPVKVVGDMGPAFKKLSINPGDTVFNFIDQICKYRAVLPLSDGLGGLILTKPGKSKSPGFIKCGEDGNVKSRNGKISHYNRFSTITVKGNADAAELVEADAETLAGSEGKSKDPDIVRARPLILIAEREGYDLDMKERAEWEVRHRRFSGVEMTYTLPGWEAAAGEFWKINTSVPVRDPKANIARDMLIKSVTLSRGPDGTTSQITVAPNEAYDLPPGRQDNDDTQWGGGL